MTLINNQPILIFSVCQCENPHSGKHTNHTHMHTSTHTFCFAMHSWIISFLHFLSFPSFLPSFLPSSLLHSFPSSFYFFPFMEKIVQLQTIILVSGSAYSCLLTHSTITEHLCKFQLWWYLDEKISFHLWGLHSLQVRWIQYNKTSAITIVHCIWILCKSE